MICFKLKPIGIFSFLLLALAACQNKPDFPRTPAITFESISRSLNEFSGENVLVKIRFQDGNGDLGITDDERTPIRPLRPSNQTPFYEYTYTFNSAGAVTDSTRNKFYYNYFVKVLKKNTTTNLFEPVVFPNVNTTYDYAFKPLYEGNRKTPMEGILEYSMLFFPGADLKKNDILKFEIQICDREKNISNSIVTNEITLKFE